MSDIRNREELLRALRAAASRPRSDNEVEEQRLSFIMGNFDESSGVTRERIKEVLRSSRKVAEAS